MDPGHFTAYHVGFICSAFQRAGHADPVLFRHLAGVALRIPAPDFSLKAAANILGAFAHFGVQDAALSAHLSRVISAEAEEGGSAVSYLVSAAGLGAPLDTVRSFGLQAVGGVIKAFSDGDTSDLRLFRALSDILLQLPTSAFEAKVRPAAPPSSALRGPRALTRIALTAVPARAQSVAGIVRKIAATLSQPRPAAATASLRRALDGAAGGADEDGDERLLRHMAGVAIILAIRGQSPGADAAAVLPAFAAALDVQGPRRLYGPVRYWSSEVVRQFGARLQEEDDPSAFTPAELAAVIVALARAGPGAASVPLFRHLGFPPPLPTVAPTRFPTVHSLPRSLPGR
jgi:hypothetical protein